MHIPYLTPFYGPFWLKVYITGPWDQHFYEVFFSDVCSGLIVAVTLIPQGLSYASLAKMPPISGLYSIILSGMVYLCFGTCMQLGVGPVALVSLLTGSLIEKYEIDYTNDMNAVVHKLAN